MKNLIIYFYGIVPDKIKTTNAGYYIYANEREYFLKENARTIEELYELYNLSKESSVLHKIVINKYNMILSQVDSREYILLEIRTFENRKINLDDILELSRIEITGKFKHINRNNWRMMWINKLDYLEYNFQEFEKDLIKYFDYNIGLAENGLQILMHIDNTSQHMCHINLNSETRIIEFYDPTNIVLDTRVRDICEFYRNIIDDNPNKIEELPLKMLDDKEKTLLFVRTLFNKEYFDILMNRIEIDVNKIYEKMKNHELAIRILYKKLKEFLPEIEWLKKTS